MQIDLNAVLSAALRDAVFQATKPLQDEIACLLERIKVLESRPSGTIDVTSVTFVGAVEAIATRCANEVTKDTVVTALQDMDLSDHFDIDDAVHDALSGMDLSDHFDIHRAVKDVVSELTFEVSVS